MQIKAHQKQPFRKSKQRQNGPRSKKKRKNKEKGTAYADKQRTKVRLSVCAAVNSRLCQPIASLSYVFYHMFFSFCRQFDAKEKPADDASHLIDDKKAFLSLPLNAKTSSIPVAGVGVRAPAVASEERKKDLGLCIHVKIMVVLLVVATAT